MELLIDIWNTLKPFIVGYISVLIIIGIAGLILFGFVVKQMYTSHKEFKKMQNNRRKY